MILTLRRGVVRSFQGGFSSSLTEAGAAASAAATGGAAGGTWRGGVQCDRRRCVPVGVGARRCLTTEDRALLEKLRVYPLKTHPNLIDHIQEFFRGSISLSDLLSGEDPSSARRREDALLKVHGFDSDEFSANVGGAFQAVLDANAVLIAGEEHDGAGGGEIPTREQEDAEDMLRGCVAPTLVERLEVGWAVGEDKQQGGQQRQQQRQQQQEEEQMERVKRLLDRQAQDQESILSLLRQIGGKVSFLSVLRRLGTISAIVDAWMFPAPTPPLIPAGDVQSVRLTLAAPCVVDYSGWPMPPSLAVGSQDESVVAITKLKVETSDTYNLGADVSNLHLLRRGLSRERGVTGVTKLGKPCSSIWTVVGCLSGPAELNWIVVDIAVYRLGS